MRPITTTVCAVAMLATLTTAGRAQLPYTPPQVGAKPAAPPKAAKKLPVWSPRPAAAVHLDSERTLSNWRIRPPKGYVFLQKADGANQVYILQGDMRANGSSPIIRVMTGQILGTQKKTHTDIEVMESYIIQLHHHYGNWKATEPEFGLIQGRRFIRRRWTGSEAIPGGGGSAALHGALYLTVDGKQFHSVAIQDVDPGSTTTLPLMEAAALTFHKM